MSQLQTKRFWDSSRLVTASFGTIIVVGTILLMLPLATRHGSLSFIDALFTATAATCVTGLTVQATGFTFSV